MRIKYIVFGDKITFPQGAAMHLKSNGDYIIKSEMVFAEALQKNCVSGNPTDSRKKRKSYKIVLNLI